MSTASSMLVLRALREGVLQRPDACVACGAEGRVFGHHDDYARPLDVRWLCGKCHTRWHAENGPGKPAGTRPFNLGGARKSAQLSQRALAEVVSVGTGVVRSLEHGDATVNPASALKIADYFGVKVTDIWPVEAQNGSGEHAR